LFKQTSEDNIENSEHKPDDSMTNKQPEKYYR